MHNSDDTDNDGIKLKEIDESLRINTSVAMDTFILDKAKQVAESKQSSGTRPGSKVRKLELKKRKLAFVVPVSVAAGVLVGIASLLLMQSYFLSKPKEDTRQIAISDLSSSKELTTTSSVSGAAKKIISNEELTKWRALSSPQKRDYIRSLIALEQMNKAIFLLIEYQKLIKK